MENTQDLIVEIQSNKEFLRSLQIPQQTSRYKPVGHGQLMDITEEALDRCNFLLTKEEFTYNAFGNKANGKYHIGWGNDPDMGLMIAWQNSYNKTLSLKFAVGASVFICENGMVKGDMGTFKSKHVGDIQTVTPKLLAEYISGAGETFNKMVVEKRRMKEIEVTKRTASELMGRLFMEEAIITSTQLNIVNREMKDPTFDYGSPGSLWELYNHVTYSLKTASPNTWMQQQIDNHQFFTQEYGIAEKA